MTHTERQGSVTALVAVVAAALSAPPAGAERAMALVVSPAGGGDHLGLLIHGQPSPGGLDLLASVISARTHPQAAVLLEWTLAGSPPLRHYQGWAVWREAEGIAWRQLNPAEVRAHPGLKVGVPLCDDPRARFDP